MRSAIVRSIAWTPVRGPYAPRQTTAEILPVLGTTDRKAGSEENARQLRHVLRILADEMARLRRPSLFRRAAPPRGGRDTDVHFDAVVIKTVNGIVTSWPRSAETLFGYMAAEMVGNPITRIFQGERLSEEEELLTRIRSGERIENYRTTRRTKGGRIVNISISLMPIKDSRGDGAGVLKTIHVELSERDEIPAQDRRPGYERVDLCAAMQGNCRRNAAERSARDGVR